MIEYLGFKYLEEHERNRANEEFHDLTIRTQNCLKNAGLYSKEQVVKFFDITYEKSQLMRIPNYGRKSHKEITEWLGLGNKIYKADFKQVSLRDYFAAKAIQNFSWTGENDKECAVSCYEIADAMMEARKNVS